MSDLTVCIGYDTREAVAWHVCAHSIITRASRPVRLMPIMLSSLGGTYERARDVLGSTEFSLSRFLTPYVAHNGVSIFVDCDFLFLADVWELYDEAMKQNDADVLCVQHSYTPRMRVKFHGAAQNDYPCKNWSSLMVFNGHRQAVRNLTPAYVNMATPAELHRMAWARKIGALPVEWNHLVGEYAPRPASELKAIHWTCGGPWFREYHDAEHAALWRAEFEHMSNAMQMPYQSAAVLEAAA